MAPENYIILTVLGMFCMLFLGSVGLIQLMRQKAKKRALVEKIINNTPHHGQLLESNNVKPQYNTKGILSWAPLRKLGEKFAPQQSETYSVLKRRFLRAGIRTEAAPALFWSFKIITPVVLVMCFAVIRLNVLKVFSPQATIAVGVTWALLGFYLPNLWLRIKTANRSDTIFRGLPDALDLMVVSVEAGMGLDAAFQRVGEELALSNRALSDEFKLLNLELRAGQKRHTALRNLSDRIDLEDVRSLTTLLIQTDQFGTSIAQALRVFADTFRTKRFQKAEEIAAKIPVKLIFPLGVFIFPAMFIVTIGPGVIRIYQNLLMR